MENLTVEKHWFTWFMPSLISIICICTLVLIPVAIIIMLYTFLRWKFDKIEFKDGCFYSRIGLIMINRKSIPIEQISFIDIKADFISEAMHMGTIQVQSSAFAKAISYNFIKEPEKITQYVNAYKAQKTN